jgi:hypothetical protein
MGIEDDEMPTIWSEEDLLLSKLLCYPESNRCDDKIQMEVIDYGVGISEERFQKLGEIFYSNNE